MNYPDKDIIEDLRKQYSAGTRVRLIHMDDPYTKIPVGNLGTVQSVDDIGTIRVHWDSGHTLGVVYGEDSCEVI